MWGIEPQTSTKHIIVLYQLRYIPNIYYKFTTISFNILVILNQTKINRSIFIGLEMWGIEPQTSTNPNFYYCFHYNHFYNLLHAMPNDKANHLPLQVVFLKDLPGCYCVEVEPIPRAVNATWTVVSLQLHCGTATWKATQFVPPCRPWCDLIALFGTSTSGY